MLIHKLWPIKIWSMFKRVAQSFAVFHIKLIGSRLLEDLNLLTARFTAKMILFFLKKCPCRIIRDRRYVKFVFNMNRLACGPYRICQKITELKGAVCRRKRSGAGFFSPRKTIEITIAIERSGNYIFRDELGGFRGHGNLFFLLIGQRITVKGAQTLSARQKQIVKH